MLNNANMTFFYRNSFDMLISSVYFKTFVIKPVISIVTNEGICDDANRFMYIFVIKKYNVLNGSLNYLP